MRPRIVGVLLVILLSAAGVSASAEDDITGTYKGSCTMNVKIPSMNQDTTKSGPATIEVSKIDGMNYQLHIKTELADLPNSDETSTYTKSGSSLRRNETQTVGTMSMVSSADLSVSGSSLTGTVETKATSEDGELQSQARTTFQLSKQTAAE